MKKIDLFLNYEEICSRIEADMGSIKPTLWAELIGVTVNVVSNIHGGRGNRHPSVEYTIAVSRTTGKPAEWYLYGSGNEKFHIAESTIKYCGASDFMYGWTDDQRDAYQALKEIIESGDKIAIAAIMSNLAAFRESIKKNYRIEKLEKDVKELKKGRPSDHGAENPAA